MKCEETNQFPVLLLPEVRSDLSYQIKNPSIDIKSCWLGWCAEQASPENGKFVFDTSTWENQPGALGWEDVQNLDCAIVERTINNDAIPNGPIERVIQYVDSLAIYCPERDYQAVLQYFKQHLSTDDG